MGLWAGANENCCAIHHCFFRQFRGYVLLDCPRQLRSPYWYERYAAAAAEQAERDRVRRDAVAAQQAKDDEIRRLRETRFQAALVAAIRLRDSMKNPDGFRLDRTTRANDGSFCYFFRATNSSNALVPGRAVFVDGVLHVTGEDTFLAAWLTHCDGRGVENFDMVAYALNNLVAK